MRKICVVTSNRAEYWLLKPLMQLLKISQSVDLQVVVAGAHLSDAFGKTINQVRKDGFTVDATVTCLPESDDEMGMIQAISEGMSNFAKAFKSLQPEIIVILGDRFEIFAAAQSAYCLKIPIAHLHGGELTQAAFDEGFRHANSKFSHLHFVSHPEYKARLMRMGEQPDRIWVTGAIGIDGISEFKPATKSALSNVLGFNLEQFILLTYHPSTLDHVPTEIVANNIINALDAFPNYQILITQSNPDPAGRLLNEIWQDYQQKYPKRVCYTQSLGDYYHTAVCHSHCVLGNSSSGILEVPYLGKRVINLGNRQVGRIFPSSVFQVKHDTNDIVNALQRVAELPASEPEQVYGEPGEIASTIVNVLETVSLQNVISKEFYDG